MHGDELNIAPVFQIGPVMVTNTVVTTWAVMGLLALFAWLATRRLKLCRVVVHETCTSGCAYDGT